ncbi:MAG TPA: ZIP family metal transporter [Streptosporangiaceae bacterium]|nr:ZIP family metal transporter [Streptosporangiaceae bacterium]
MPAVIWIVAASAAMALTALSGSITLALPGPMFNRVVLPLVAVAAGSLLGGALFHLLPEAVTLLGNHLAVYGWVAGGVLAFFLLEQYLHWHHCHRAPAAHRPLGYLILIADAFHNLIDGLAIGAAFIVSTELGIVTWLVLAAQSSPNSPPPRTTRESHPHRWFRGGPAPAPDHRGTGALTCRPPSSPSRAHRGPPQRHRSQTRSGWIATPDPGTWRRCVRRLQSSEGPTGVNR